MRYERHVFVCMNYRPRDNRPSCGLSDTGGLLMALQMTAFQRGLTGRVAFNGTTCLGPCDEGPNVVVYPEGVWYAGVSVADAEEIVESHLMNGQPVERLMYTWPTY